MNLMPSTQGSVPQKTGIFSSGRNGKIEAEQESHPVDQREHHQVDQGHEPDAELEVVPSPPPGRLDKRSKSRRRHRRIRRHASRRRAGPRLRAAVRACRRHPSAVDLIHSASGDLLISFLVHIRAGLVPNHSRT